jgi:hypothetical protein
VTVALPGSVHSDQVAAALSVAGVEIAWASGYLRKRNWVQICLMGEFDDVALLDVPRLLLRAVQRGSGSGSGSEPTQA